MTAGALIDDEVLQRIDFVDEEPVGAEVAFPAALPGADELMVLELWGQAFSSQDAGHHRFQFGEVVTSQSQALNVPFELPGVSRGEHQSFRRAKRSSASRQ